MDDLIIVKDSFAIRKSNIQRIVWTTVRGEKILEVNFADPAIADNGKNWWQLEGDEALEVWEKFTGQAVSWDSRPDE